VSRTTTFLPTTPLIKSVGKPEGTGGGGWVGAAEAGGSEGESMVVWR